MVSVQYSVFKITTCWQAVTSRSSQKKGKAFSTMIRLRDVRVPKKSLIYEAGRYHWKVCVKDIYNRGEKVQGIDRVCQGQDLYKLRYEKIFYEKSLLMRRISLIRLSRRLPEIPQTSLVGLNTPFLRQVEPLVSKKI